MRLKVLVTSGTRTSADLLARRLPPGSLHQFFPLDVPRYMRRFLDHWRPDLVLFAESEIWPNTVIELGRRDIPLVMVNGRMSERSFRRWSRLPGTARALLERFALCVAQSPMDAERLARLGALRVGWPAIQIRRAAPPAEPAPSRTCRPRRRAAGLDRGQHPSRRGGAVAAVHQALANRLPGLLTILAPRHPERGASDRRIAEDAGLRAIAAVRGRASGARGRRLCGRHYRGVGPVLPLAPLVFIGGSLVRHGGQNPIEPAKLGARSCTGRTSTISPTSTPPSISAGGALAVTDAGPWRRRWPTFSTDAGLVRAMAQAAAADGRARSDWRRSTAPCGRSSRSSRRRSEHGLDARARLLAARSALSRRPSAARSASSTAPSRRGACGARASERASP